MRLIHFSDTHLGFAESSKVDQLTGINAREQDVYRVFDAVIDAAIERKPDLVIHAGDLFHSARPSNRAIVMALIGFQRLSAAGIPLVVIAGNHSVPRVAGSGSIFDALKVLQGVRSAHGCRYEVFEIGDAAIHCLPHVPSEEGLKEALASVKIRGDRKYNVLVIHAAVRGTEEGSSLVEFNQIGVSAAAIASLADFDYVALGHYHKHLEVAPRACYSGSTERLHVNEAGYRKGFLEVDLAARKQKFHSLSPREIILMPQLQCRGKAASGIVADLREAFLRKVEEMPKGAIVVVRLAEIDPVTWMEIQKDRRALERELLSHAFEVRWEKSFAEKKPGRSGGCTIGSLATEFAAFMRGAGVEGLDRARLVKLGDRMIAQALEEEARS